MIHWSLAYSLCKLWLVDYVLFMRECWGIIATFMRESANENASFPRIDMSLRLDFSAYSRVGSDGAGINVCRGSKTFRMFGFTFFQWYLPEVNSGKNVFTINCATDIA